MLISIIAGAVTALVVFIYLIRRMKIIWTAGDDMQATIELMKVLGAVAGGGIAGLVVFVICYFISIVVP